MCSNLSYVVFGERANATVTNNIPSPINKAGIITFGSALAIGVALIIIAATAHLAATVQMCLYVGGGIAPFAGWAIWRIIKECYTSRLRNNVPITREEQIIIEQEETKALTQEQTEWLKGRIQFYVQSGRLQEDLNSRKDWGREYSHLLSATEKHIHAVINNKEFQKNSNSYLDAWAKILDCCDPSGYIEWRKNSHHPLPEATLNEKEVAVVEGKAFFVIAQYEFLCTFPPELRETETKKRKL